MEKQCVNLFLNSFLPKLATLNNANSQRSIKHLSFQRNERIPEARDGPLLAISEKSTSTTPSSGNLGSWIETRANDDWKGWKVWKKLCCKAMWEYQNTKVQWQLMYLWLVSTFATAMWLFLLLSIQKFGWLCKVSSCVRTKIKCLCKGLSVLRSACVTVCLVCYYLPKTFSTCSHAQSRTHTHILVNTNLY